MKLEDAPNQGGMDGTSEMESLSDRLTEALRAVIRGSPLEGLGPIEVARTLEIDKSLASRLMSALRARDPLEALTALPGAAPIRRFVTAARAHGASPRAATAAERMVREFERTLQRTFGTRTHLDAALSDAVPGARRRQQDAARQSVYRGMALLKGVSIDLVSTTWIVRPGHPGRVDIRVLAAFIGMRRLRPTARVQLVTSHATRRPRDPAALLAEFSTPRDLSVSSHRAGRHTMYELSSLPIGRDAGADVYMTELIPDAADRRVARGARLAYGDTVTHPCKRLVLTMLVHPEVWAGCGLSLRAYDTAGRGLVDLWDPSRDAERLPLEGAIERGVMTPGALRSSPVPRYAEVVEHVADGLDLTGFRVFSCELVYPLYGAHVMMMLEP